jgi:molybdopterin molybdotransferase
LLAVSDAQAQALAAAQPLAAETLALGDALGRVLAAPAIARLTQPPFHASAMDGYAVRWADVERLPARLSLVGVSRGGSRWNGGLTSGQTVRLFTGAVVPEGADTVVVQEDATAESDQIVIRDRPARLGGHIRKAGQDFQAGETLGAAGVRLGPALIALLAAGNVAEVAVARRPRVALLSTGDELVSLGGEPGPDQIISSNGLALAGLLAGVGAQVKDFGVVADSLEALSLASAEAEAAADLVITIGGASVGERDLVQAALNRRGADLSFWKIAMRPGKPLMFGKLPGAPVFGLPGNPVSAYVCALLFVLPFLRALQGEGQPLPAPLPARCRTALPANGKRADYLRARLFPGPQGVEIEPCPIQDSAMLSILAHADALLVRAPEDPAASPHAWVEYLPLPTAR